MRLFWIAIGILALGLLALLLLGDQGTVFGLASDSFARLVYTGALLTVLMAALVGSGIRLGGALRSIAIWLAIIMVLVAGYQYRYEIQDVASRLTAGLIPGSPLSVVDGDGRANVMLEKLASGHFGIRARVNDVPVSMMVDTGATATVLTFQDAQRAGFDPETLGFNVPIMTANGQAMAARVVADRLDVGEISRSRLTLLVVEDGQLGESLLGMNFIGSLSGFTVRGDRMVLID